MKTIPTYCPHCGDDELISICDWTCYSELDDEHIKILTEWQCYSCQESFWVEGDKL